MGRKRRRQTRQLSSAVVMGLIGLVEGAELGISRSRQSFPQSMSAVSGESNLTHNKRHTDAHVPADDISVRRNHPKSSGYAVQERRRKRGDVSAATRTDQGLSTLQAPTKDIVDANNGHAGRHSRADVYSFHADGVKFSSGNKDDMGVTWGSFGPQRYNEEGSEVQVSPRVTDTNNMQHEGVVLSAQGHESDKLLKNNNLESLHAQKLRHRNRSRRHEQVYGGAVEKADMNAMNALKFLNVAIIDDKVIEQNGVDRNRLRRRHHDSDATDVIGGFTGEHTISLSRHDKGRNRFRKHRYSPIGVSDKASHLQSSDLDLLHQVRNKGGIKNMERLYTFKFGYFDRSSSKTKSSKSESRNSEDDTSGHAGIGGKSTKSSSETDLNDDIGRNRERRHKTKRSKGVSTTKSSKGLLQSISRDGLYDPCLPHNSTQVRFRRHKNSKGNNTRDCSESSKSSKKSGSSTPLPVPSITPAPSVDVPSRKDTPVPTIVTDLPTVSSIPSQSPSELESEVPSTSPSSIPSFPPSDLPSTSPSGIPSQIPSNFPSTTPSAHPSTSPSLSSKPTMKYQPSNSPSLSVQPSAVPSIVPSVTPSDEPSSIPSRFPSAMPSSKPSSRPSLSPSESAEPTMKYQPSSSPSLSGEPSKIPSLQPSINPSSLPSAMPSSRPSSEPSSTPSDFPSKSSAPSKR